MKKGSILLLFAVLGVVAVIYAAPDWIVDPPIHRDAITVPNDKYDGDCTGHETAGRCFAKCPDGSQPRDIEHTNTCPTESVSTPAPAVYNAIEPPDVQPFAGK